MPKHTAEDNESSDFWKKMRYGAAAAVTLGSGIYAAASVLKKPGLVSNIVDDVKIAMHAAPQLLQPEQVAPNVPMHSAGDEEARAVLNMQLQFAMQHQDMQRAQDISRQLDQLDGGRARTSPHGNGPMDANFLSKTVTTHSSTQASSQPPLQPPSQMPSQMPTPASMQMPIPTGMQMNVPVSMQIPMLSTNTQVGMQAPDLSVMQGKIEATVRPPSCNATKPAGPQLSPRQVATLQLKGGDIVEALDPVTGQWSPAIIHTIAKNGLIEVRWNDPGTDANGRPFHPIGEVWAEQIRVKHRKSPTLMMTGEPRADDDEVITPPDGLQIGDNCFAAGTVIEKKWFHARLIGIRVRLPPMRIEYVSTLDGQTNELLLPSPRKDYVYFEQIRRNKPEQTPEALQTRRVVRDEKAEKTGAETKQEMQAEKTGEETQQEMQAAEAAHEDDVVITPDLMCSVCERPDDESKMLVCDCKSGYHTYCLSPPLDGVPEGDWHCPSCMKMQ